VIDSLEFSKGIGTIAVQVRHPLSPQESDAFFLAFEHETDAPEWSAFCATAAIRHGWRFLPGVVELLDALRLFRGETPLHVEAVEAYERVVASGEPSTQGGTNWSWRAVARSCGPAAARAFLAAGGHNAFATSWNEGKRREFFVLSYVQEARAEPSSRLLPAGPTMLALPASPDSPIGEQEAAALVERVRARSIVVAAPREIEYRPLSAEQWDERIAELRRQAAEMLAAEHAPPAGMVSGDGEAAGRGEAQS
jgi:hypothetical protein